MTSAQIMRPVELRALRANSFQQLPQSYHYIWTQQPHTLPALFAQPIKVTPRTISSHTAEYTGANWRVINQLPKQMVCAGRGRFVTGAFSDQPATFRLVFAPA